MKYIKIIIFITLFFYGYSVANAATIENFKFDANTNKIEISGLCEGKNIMVKMFSLPDETLFYSAGQKCEAGQYNFFDDLKYWKIPIGEYQFAVYDANSPLSNSSEDFQFNVIKEFPEDENDNSQSEESVQNIFKRIISWLKNIVVALKELVVQKITTSQLCVGDTCIDERQLEEILKKSNKHKGNDAPPFMPLPKDADKSSLIEEDEKLEIDEVAEDEIKESEDYKNAEIEKPAEEENGEAAIEEDADFDESDDDINEDDADFDESDDDINEDDADFDESDESDDDIKNKDKKMAEEKDVKATNTDSSDKNNNKPIKYEDAE